MVEEVVEEMVGRVTVPREKLGGVRSGSRVEREFGQNDAKARSAIKRRRETVWIGIGWGRIVVLVGLGCLGCWLVKGWATR